MNSTFSLIANIIISGSFHETNPFNPALYPGTYKVRHYDLVRNETFRNGRKSPFSGHVALSVREPVLNQKR